MCYLYQSSWDCMSCFDVASHYLHRHQCFSWSNQLQLVPHGIHYILNKLKMATLNSEKQNQIYLLFLMISFTTLSIFFISFFLSHCRQSCFSLSLFSLVASVFSFVWWYFSLSFLFFFIPFFLSHWYMSCFFSFSFTLCTFIYLRLWIWCCMVTCLKISW